jgi:dUTP diphosphatase
MKMENNLKVLNRIDILELVNRQKLLDEKFNEKNKNNSKLRPRNRVNTLIALNTELGEVMQDTKGKWNFWKINCKFDKEHTLEEISDYLHFLLQYIYSDDELFKEIENRNDELNATFEKHIEKLLENRKEEQNIENSLLFLSLPVAYELVGFKFEIEEVFQLFSAITVILDELGSNWKEFLKVHHKKFELNYYKRTKEDY